MFWEKDIVLEVPLGVLLLLIRALDGPLDFPISILKQVLYPGKVYETNPVMDQCLSNYDPALFSRKKKTSPNEIA